jgi:hypothetical protein
LPDAVYRVPPFDGDALALNFDENSSSLGAGSFNYIRMAHLNEAVADEGALLRKVFEYVLGDDLVVLLVVSDDLQASSTRHWIRRDNVCQLRMPKKTQSPFILRTIPTKRVVCLPLATGRTIWR